MNVLIILLTVVEVLVSLLLIAVILLQRGKGEGAGVSFGGAAEAVFGAQMGNVLTKSTIVLAFVFLVNTLFLSILVARRGGSGTGSLMDGEVAPRPVATAPAAPLGMPDAESGEDAASVLDDVPVAAEPAGDAASVLDDIPVAAAPAAEAAPAEAAAAAE